jgi:magnesium chelatase family protein
VRSVALVGLDAHLIDVEVDIAGGLPQFSVVGLPDATVRESRDRVRSALKNTGFHFPAKKITVNLAPANVKKEGAGLDLAIAIGILLAEEVIGSDSLTHRARGRIVVGRSDQADLRSPFDRSGLPQEL